ncbi:FG-GAP-like repeat-containing protein [Candidatus Neomarinimicrobiota bacterium]
MINRRAISRPSWNRISAHRALIYILPLIFLLPSVTSAQGGSWVTKTPIPTERYQFISEVVNDSIYVIGGYNGGYYTRNEVYDPVSDTWTTKAPMTQQREGAASGFVNGKIYVIGGTTTSSNKSVEEYDPATDSWISKNPMAMSIEKAAGAVVGEKIYIIGGWDGTQVLNTVWEYEPGADTWTDKAPMPTARNYISASVVNGIIYVFGGGDGAQGLTTVEAYDPALDTWATKASLTATRLGALSAVAGGKIYLIGGSVSSVAFSNTVLQYDPANDSWTDCDGSCAPMPTGRMFLGGAAVNGKIYTISGEYMNGYVMTDAVEEYTPPTDLVAYYPFNGNANDESGNGNDGTVNGATLAMDRFGNANNAYDFDGVDDYITTAAKTWGFSTEGSISAWIKTTSPGEITVFSLGHGSAQDELLLQIEGNNKIGIYNHKQIDNYNVRASSTSVNTGDWVHVVGVISGGGSPSNLIVYVNGIQETGTTLTVGVPTDISDTIPREARLGWRTGEVGNPFNGDIDDIRIYNRALSAAEIEALYHEGGWDLTPPTIVSTFPAQNALHLPLDGAISVTFDIPMNGASIDNTTFVVHGSQTGRLNGIYSYNPDDSTATFTPVNPFKVGEQVSVTLTTAVQSAAGDMLVSPYTWSFTGEVLGGNGTFAAATNYSVGSYPYSVAAADLDGDGAVDLVAHNGNSHDVSVLLNNGDGTFKPAVNYSVGTGPTFVIIADLDGDDTPDLAVSNGTSGNISVLLGNGNGTFATAVPYGAGSTPWSLDAADLDGDADVDLVAANSASANLSVLLNDGTGTFASAVNYQVGLDPRLVQAADLNGDGTLDLAVTNSGDGNVSVLLGSGTGTFAAAANHPAGSAPWSLEVIDLNVDGDLDLVTANSGSGNLSVLLGGGDGTFATPVNYGAGSRPYSVIASDLDGDGDSDLAAANFLTNNVSVLANNGDGTFATTMNYGVGTGTYCVTAVDLDGDGDNDLAVANATSNNVSVLLNTGEPIDETPPAAPTNFTATASDQEVSLTWSANSEPDLSHYVVYQGSEMSFAPVPTDSVARVDAPDTSVVIIGLVNGSTYFYRIVAVDQAGNKSVYSLEVNATPLAIPTEGLVAYYPFNGNANDESGNGNDGISWATLAPDRFGNTNSAYSFNGTDEGIYTTVRPTTDALSISMWLKSSGSADYSAVVLCHDGIKKTGLSLDSPATQLRFFLKTLNTTTSIAATDQNYLDDTWHHVVCWYDGATAKLIVDNAEKGSAAITGTLDLGDSFRIANDAGAVDRDFSGLIDDIRIYTRALSASEIKALYHEGGWDPILPTIVSTFPAQNALNVALDGAISVTFDMPMDEGTIVSTTFVVHGSHTGRLTGVYSYNPGDSTATFTPASPFKAGEQVSVTLTRGVQGAAGDTLATPYAWDFIAEVLGGSGEFEAAANYGAGDGPNSVFASDLDGDGDADLAIANYNSNSVSVLLNNGDGTYAAKTDYGAGSAATSVFASDLDGDGDPDLAVANSGSNNVSVLLNNGNGIFAAKIDYATGAGPRSVISADLDSDGDLDLAAVNYGSNNLSVLLNNGDGTFAAKIDYAAGDAPESIVAADVDGDGAMDLAVANWSDNVAVLLNSGNGAFAAKIGYTAGNGSRSIFSADLNSDGDMDLVVANYYSHDASVLLNTATGTFPAKIDYAAGTNPCSVFSADLDGDGDLDMAVANSISHNVSVLLNNGDGTFAGTTNYAAGISPRSVFPADLDGDGDLDLAVANRSSNNVSVLLNTSRCNATSRPKEPHSYRR